jgi:hypothetical protein
MIRKLTISGLEFTFVFRHRWDIKSKIIFDLEFRKYRIGLWFDRQKVVGVKNFNNPKEWGNNLVNEYTIGIDLVICKAWVSFNNGKIKFL